MQFVDTDVLLYAVSRDPAERDKARRANEILDEGDVALSTRTRSPASAVERYPPATATM